MEKDRPPWPSVPALAFLSVCLPTAIAQVPDPELLPTSPPKKPDPVTSETVVFWGLRLWQVIGVFSMFILAVVITLCCIFKCRIPEPKRRSKPGTHKGRQQRHTPTPSKRCPPERTY